MITHPESRPGGLSPTNARGYFTPTLVGSRYQFKASADWIALDSTSGVMPATIRVKWRGP
jgi:hypothetical protein